MYLLRFLGRVLRGEFSLALNFLSKFKFDLFLKKKYKEIILEETSQLNSIQTLKKKKEEGKKKRRGGVWHFLDSERIWIRHNFIGTNFNILGFLRIRNESLILEDTLNHLSQFVDAICVYDDASNDLSKDICKKNKKVVMMIENDKWLKGIDNRLLSETRHRGILLQEANNIFQFKWAFFSDADERYIGSFKNMLNYLELKEISGVRVKLFDAYMTVQDRLPYRNGKLLNFRKYFGPERRDILVFFRNNKKVKFIGLNSREPVIEGKIITKFFCQHYGKSLSEKHWEETCNYYTENFPWDPYGKKWSARKGKSIHTESDFNRLLYKWGKNLFKNSVINFE